MRRTATVLLAVLAALLVFGATLTSAQIAQNGNYKLEQAVIGSGGGTNSDTTNNVYKVEGTIGEPIAGTTSSNMVSRLKGVSSLLMSSRRLPRWFLLPARF